MAALWLAGCSNPNGPSTLPHVTSGIEVPDDILNEPRVVPVPASNNISDQPYPRLGDVPSKPKTFSPKPVIDQAMNEMEFDRTQAQKDEADYLNPSQMPRPDQQPYNN